MIDVTAYIRDLLFTHDCVILPSFGGFIGNYTPARIDTSTNTFYPPVKAISFNRNLNQNDGLLISRISADRGIGYADSRRLVEEFVSDLVSKLKKGDRITLDMIGHLQNNGEGNPLFEPDRSSNFLLDSYGLTSFTREPVSGYDVSERVLRKRDLSSTPVLSRKMLWRAAVVIPVLAAIVFVPLKTDIFRHNASLNPLARTEIEAVSGEIETSSTLEQNIDLPVPAKEESQPVIGETRDQVSQEAEISGPVSTEGAGLFFLVTGSFKARNNAIGQQNSLNERGYHAEITTAPNGYFRVCATSYGTYREAKEAQESILGEFPGTWILKK
jgi:hypothetical protein